MTVIQMENRQVITKNQKASSAFSLTDLWFNKTEDFYSEPISEANLQKHAVHN